MEWYWIVLLLATGIGIGALLCYLAIGMYFIKNNPFG